MAATSLTTREVAKLLQVSAATVKRWADDGVITSQKTVGGHRRFDLAGIARFRREQGSAPPAQTEGRGKRRIEAEVRLTHTRLLRCLEEGDEADATAELISAYLKGHKLATLFDQVVAPALKEVGDLWHRGELSIADEHLASRTVIFALQGLRAAVQNAAPANQRAIVCGAEGDLHELPVHMVHTLLENAGWDVINLGANMPFFALEETLAKHRPELLCVSMKLLADPDRLAREYAQLRKLAQKLKIAIVLGGDAVADPVQRERFHADLHASSFAQLARFAQARERRL